MSKLQRCPVCGGALRETYIGRCCNHCDVIDKDGKPVTKHIEVMSKQQAEQYGMAEHDEHSLVISIASRGTNKAFIVPNTKSNIEDVIWLEFNDTDSTDMVYGGIEYAHTDKIRETVLRFLATDSVTRLIVQCEAGQSRSAGTAAAIMKFIYNDDSSIFNNQKYTPNMMCYRKVLNNLMGMV